jgi:hypothetical protein
MFVDSEELQQKQHDGTVVCNNNLASSHSQLLIVPLEAVGVQIDKDLLP